MDDQEKRLRIMGVCKLLLLGGGEVVRIFKIASLVGAEQPGGLVLYVLGFFLTTGSGIVFREECQKL